MPTDPLAALLALVSSASPAALARDALVLAHLAAMAVGLGTVIVTEIALLRYLAAPLPAERAAALWRTHRTVCLALAALWASGLGLLALDPGAAGPKLVGKLATVGALSLTALGMGRAALPMLSRGAGVALLALPLGRKMALGLCAGLSMGGWGTALMLGAAATAGTAGADAVAALVLLGHGATVAAVLAGVLAGHLWWSRAARARAPVRLT